MPHTANHIPGVGFQPSGNFGGVPQGQFNFGGQQQGGNFLSSLLGGAGGAVAPFNPLLGAGISFGSSLLSGLGGLLSGPSTSQKNARRVSGLIQNQLGQSVLDPDQVFGQIQSSLAPQFNRQAEGVNRRLGLDSGVAQGELARFQQSTLSGILAQLNQFNAQATSNRDVSLLQLLTQNAQNT